MGKWKFYTSKELKAGGWLRRRLRIQADGLCGNLDRVWRDVRDSAWIGGDAEGWERVPYWLDGFIPLAYLLKDDDMIARAKKYIDAIIDRQCPDGWICPCDEVEREKYDTWAVLLITKVLVVYYECSGDERVPKVIYDTLKNYYGLMRDGAISLFEWGKFRWYEGFIAVNFAYERWGEEWIADLGRILKEQGADYTEFMPLWRRPLNLWRFETHIVNIAMMLKSEAVSYELLGEEYTDLAERLYSELYKYNGTVFGGFTGDECLSGISPIQGTELCAVVEQMYSYELLYAATGDAKWAERLELMAFNALPATISDDMWSHQYVQMSNQIACVKFPGKSLFRTNGRDAHIFGLEPNYGCCTANFGQGWPKLALSLFMHKGDTVINAIPLPSELHDGGKNVVLETNYPFENSFVYTIDSREAFTFKVLVPSFAKNVVVDGELARVCGGELTFEIGAGESGRITVGFETEPYFEERAGGLNTVRFGSLIFSIPIEYEKKLHEYEKNDVERKFPYCDYEYFPRSDWNYAYCGGELAVENRSVGEIPFFSEKPSLVVRARVKKIDWGLEDGYELVCSKLPDSCEPHGDAEEILLYPYGCAKLRMTELPIVE